MGLLARRGAIWRSNAEARSKAEARPNRLRRALGLASALSLVTAAGLPPMVARAGSPCESSSPASHAYTVTICITQPADGSTVVGAVAVGATVSVTGTSPGVDRPTFYLDGAYLLADWQSYGFKLPSPDFVDGAHTLSAAVQMHDGFLSSQASVTLSFQNGVTTPPVNGRSFTPTSGTTPPSGQPFVVAAAGDGASGEQRAGQVVEQLVGWNPNLFLYLGDVYDKGSDSEFYNWYGTPDRNFGRLRGITNPAIGNHEYETGTTQAYSSYWNNIPHFYSFNTAGWHFISLDDTVEFNQMDPSSVQYRWLLNDLNSNPYGCTAVYLHRPVFSVGPAGSPPELQPIWSLLAQHGVKLLLTGHDHNYQRWVPLNGSGAPAPGGVTEIVVGTGGHGISRFVRSDPSLVVGADSAPDAYGALKLAITPQAAGFTYVNIFGVTIDSGSIPCAAGADATPPTSPANLSAQPAPGSINLAWSPATDNVAVSGYTVYRDGNVLAMLPGSSVAYADTSVTPSSTHTYSTDAYDSAGNHSARASPVSATSSSQSGPVRFIQSRSTSTSRVTSTTIPMSSSVGQGDLLVGWFAQYDSSGQVHVSDSVNGAWTRAAASEKFRNGRGDIALYYRENSKAASGGLTISVSADTATYLEASASDYAGAATSGSLDQQALAEGKSSSALSTATAAVPAGELVYGAMVTGGSPGTLTPGTSQGVTFVERSQTGSGSAAGEDILNGAGGTQTAAFGLASSTDWYIIAADFRQAQAGPPDTSPPSAPSGLTAIARGPNRVDLAWSAASDNVGVTGYTVYRDGVPLAVVTGASLSFSDTSVLPSTAYIYAVDASDAANNHSSASPGAAVATPSPPDTSPPTPPSNLVATPTGATQINLSWSASGDDVGVTAYAIYRDGGLLTTVAGTTFSDTAVAPTTTYTYSVYALDAAGNQSAQSNLSGAETGAPAAPAAPSGLTASAVSPSQVSLSWTASSGASSYKIQQSPDGSTGWTQVGTSTTTAFTDTGLSPSTTYYYRVLASNTAGDSSPSNVASATTAAPWSASYSVGSTPTSWAANQTQTYSVTLTNNGNQTWAAGGGNPVHLGVHFISDGGWATDQRFTLPNDVLPGESVTLPTISVTAPGGSGSMTVEYEMVKESQFWFAQVSGVAVTVG